MFATLYRRAGSGCVIVLLTLLSAGCGAGNREDAATPAIDACAMLTEDQATAALDTLIETVRPDSLIDVGDPDANVAACTWATAGEARTLTVRIRRFSTADAATSELSSIMEPIANAGTGTELDGVGDRAIFAFNALHVQAGADLLTIRVTGLSGETALEATRQAALHLLAQHDDPST